MPRYNTGKMIHLRPNEYPTWMAAEAAGLYRPELFSWIRAGILRPRNVTGIDKPRARAWGWTLREILAARLVRRLRRAGLSAQKLKCALKKVVGEPGSLVERILVTDGRDLIDIVPPDKVVSLLTGQLYLFDLSREERDTLERVREIEAMTRERRKAAAREYQSWKRDQAPRKAEVAAAR